MSFHANRVSKRDANFEELFYLYKNQLLEVF